MRKREVVALYNFLTAMQINDLSLDKGEWKKLSDNRVALDEAIRLIDTERRELVRKYSGDVPDGEVAKVLPENMEAYQKDWVEHMQTEVDMELETIGMENLGDKMKSEVGIWEFMDYMVSK